MTIGWLDGFLAVARTGNFSRAAETLFITQPALSRTIAELEQTVGCKLFLRSQRPVALTPQGEVFYRWARTIEHDLSEKTYDAIKAHALAGIRAEEEKEKAEETK